MKLNPPEIIGTTLRGIMHRWKDATPPTAHSRWLLSRCGRTFQKEADVQPPMDGDRRCRRCFPDQ